MFLQAHCKCVICLLTFLFFFFKYPRQQYGQYTVTSKHAFCTYLIAIIEILFLFFIICYMSSNHLQYMVYFIHGRIQRRVGGGGQGVWTTISGKSQEVMCFLSKSGSDPHKKHLGPIASQGRCKWPPCEII